MELTYIPVDNNDSIEIDQSHLQGVVSKVDDVDDTSLFKSEEKGFSFLSFATTISNSGIVTTLNSRNEERRIEFDMNLNIWLDNNSLLANNNYDDSYFKKIVDMQEDAVPLILEELKKGPTPLVHALDLIYPGKVEYVGYVPLDAICSLWEAILTGKETI